MDFTGDPYPCPECFAFALPAGNYWNREGMYGGQSEGIVQYLHATPFTVSRSRLAEMVDAITQLGHRFDLFLFVGANHMVDLRDADEVAAFIDVDDEAEMH